MLPEPRGAVVSRWPRRVEWEMHHFLHPLLKDQQFSIGILDFGPSFCRIKASLPPYTHRKCTGWLPERRRPNAGGPRTNSIRVTKLQPGRQLRRSNRSSDLIHELLFSRPDVSCCKEDGGGASTTHAVVDSTSREHC